MQDLRIPEAAPGLTVKGETAVADSTANEKDDIQHRYVLDNASRPTMEVFVEI